MQVFFWSLRLRVKSVILSERSESNGSPYALEGHLDLRTTGSWEDVRYPVSYGFEVVANRKTDSLPSNDAPEVDRALESRWGSLDCATSEVAPLGMTFVEALRVRSLLSASAFCVGTAFRRSQHSDAS